MTPLDAAREIAKSDLRQIADHPSCCPFCGGPREGAYAAYGHTHQIVVSEGFEHFDECSWIARSKIVTALEAAGDMLKFGDHDPPCDPPGACTQHAEAFKRRSSALATALEAVV